METYLIKKAYPHSKKNEIIIESKKLLYTELEDRYNGCQSHNQENKELIREKCTQIAKLIREIDELNK